MPTPPKLTQTQRTRYINLRLKQLHELHPGRAHTHREIAEFCGVSHGLIQIIERGALKKLRRVTNRALSEELYDASHPILDRYRRRP